jgi:hypothetical protein
MPRYRGAFLSSDLAGLKVRVVCERCKLRRQYAGNALIERVGPEEALPELLTRIAVGLGCDLNISPTPNGLRCAMRYEYPTGWDLAGLR